MKRVLIWPPALPVLSVLFGAACAGGMAGAERPDACPDDSSLYTYRDTTRGVVPPVLIKSQMPRGGYTRSTAQGIVGPTGRVESGSVRTFGGDPEERLRAGDALYWTRFYPATRGGCAVRFLYRVTYMAGIPQRVPDELPDTTGRK